jgi:hypothetical protein
MASMESGFGGFILVVTFALTFVGGLVIGASCAEADMKIKVRERGAQLQAIYQQEWAVRHTLSQLERSGG